MITKFPLLPGNCIFLVADSRFQDKDCTWSNQSKALWTNNPSEVFANFWICFIKKSCRYINFYLYDSLLTFWDKYWWKLAAMFEKSNQQSHAAFYVGCLFVSQGMDAYKHNVMVEIKKGAYIHVVLVLCGYTSSWFYDIIILCSQTKRIGYQTVACTFIIWYFSCFYLGFLKINRVYHFYVVAAYYT